MKRLTVAIFCVILIMTASLCPTVYAASAQYARANHDEAYFYSEDKKSLFAVPKNYYVEVLDEEGEWYKVQYAEDAGLYKTLKGYCKKLDFTLETSVSDKIYLNKTITVTYNAPENNSSLPTLDNLKYEAAYYGYYKHGGEDYSYVYCQGSFGYILGKFEDYEPNTPAFANSGGTESGGAGLNFASIAFIVIASLAIVVILIIYFTTKKPRIDG